MNPISNKFQSTTRVSREGTSHTRPPLTFKKNTSPDRNHSSPAPKISLTARAFHLRRRKAVHGTCYGQRPALPRARGHLPGSSFLKPAPGRIN